MIGLVSTIDIRHQKAQFTEERIAKLRFDKNLKEPMQWVWDTYGEKVYSDIKSIEKEILEWCEKNDLDLNAKKRKAVTSPTTWKKQKELLDTASQLLQTIGTDEYSDFNLFSRTLDDRLKQNKTKLSGSEKNTILNAISWYDESAEKVIKKTQKLKGDNLNKLLQRLNCSKKQLPDYGYYPGDNKNEYIVYESESDLRDSENIPLKEDIYEYFLREVKPHVSEKRKRRFDYGYFGVKE